MLPSTSGTARDHEIAAEEMHAVEKHITLDIIGMNGGYQSDFIIHSYSTKTNNISEKSLFSIYHPTSFEIIARVNAWLKWRSVIGVLRYKNIPDRLKS